MIGPAMSRAARGLLDWSPAEVARRASIAEDVLLAFEAGQRALPPADLASLKRTFEVAGVEFIDGDESGVRLKPKPISIPVDQLTTDNDK